MELNEQNKVYLGRWWIPGDEDNQAQGTLSLPERGKAKLEIHGRWKDPADPPDKILLGPRASFNPRVIYGMAVSGQKFTLWNNASGNFTFGLVGQHTSLTPQLVLEGEHVADLSEQLFTNLVLDLTHLEEWCAQQTIFDQFTFSEDLKVIRQEYQAVPIQSQPIMLPSIGAELTIFHLIRPALREYRRLELTDTVFLKLIVPAPASFEWFEEQVEKLKIMFAFFTGKPVYLQKMILTNRAAIRTEDVSSAEAAENLNEIKQVTVSGTQPEANREAELAAKDVLVPLGALEPKPECVIDCFLQSYDELKPVYDLFLSNVYQPPYLAQNKFINLVQAMETFLRRKRPGKYLTDEVAGELAARLKTAYAEVFDQLKADLKNKTVVTKAKTDTGSINDLRNKLTGGLEYFNEKSLFSRIKSALKSLSKNERELISDDAEALFKKILTTRNYLTHFSEELAFESLTGLELYQATMALKILVILLLLAELGIEEEKRVDLIKNNQALEFKSAFIVQYR